MATLQLLVCGHALRSTGLGSLAIRDSQTSPPQADSLGPRWGLEIGIFFFFNLLLLIITHSYLAIDF